MKIFTLILCVWNANHDDSCFVVEYDLSRDDCAVLVAEWTPTLDALSQVTCQ